MSKQKITELEINGVTYVPKDQVLQSQHANFEGDIRIVILQRGWIYIGRFTRDLSTNVCTLKNSYNIRRWGTTKGLQELVHGPKQNTTLDKCEGVVEFDWLTVVHTIQVNEQKWAELIV